MKVITFPMGPRLGSNFKKVSISLLFIFFLTPYSFNIGGQGLSGNYSFLLFPLSIWFISNKIYLPHQNFRLIIYFYMMIFFIALVYQYPYYQFALRRIAGFIVFMSIFSYMSIKINEELVSCFKLSIFLITILYSLEVINMYFLYGGNDMGSTAKGSVGSQRFGFIYIMAIWITIYYIPTKKIFIILKYVAILTLLSGLLLTFSRSGIVAILGSILVFIILNVMRNTRLKNLIGKRFLVNSVLLVFVVTILYSVLSNIFPSVFDFYMDRLFSLETASGSAVFDFENPEASEGFRIYMWKLIGEFALLNPFTGSGYLGVWILMDDLSGSAHNQYMDVLFRTGIFGLSAYLWILYRLLVFLKINQPALFFGFIGVLFYGLVHETFKLSQGGFILTFMLGMLVQKLRDNGSHVSLESNSDIKKVVKN